MSQYLSRQVDRRPPLWVWTIVAGLLITTFVLYKLFVAEHVENLPLAGSEFYAVNSERLQKFTDAKQGLAQLSVVSIGTSLTHFATHSGYEAGAAFSSKEVVSLLNISRASARFVDFEPLLEQILDAHPDILLVHSDLFLFERREGAMVTRTSIKNWLRSMTWLKVNAIEREWRNQERRDCQDRGAVNTEEKISYLEELYSEQVSLPPSFIRLASRAREKGVRVVVISLARHYSLRRDHSRAFHTRQTALRVALEPFDGIPLWVSPDSWGSEYYCDFSHLNDNGRDKFMGWLLPRLQGQNDEVSQ